MSGVLENAARLSKVIGARPAGTEEEQQASFIIEETLKKAGLETHIEELNCNTNYELPRFICCAVSILLAILAIFLPLMVLPALIVCAITAVLYIMEVAGISPLNNTAKRGLSQNIVAKYFPGDAGNAAGDANSIVITEGSEDSTDIEAAASSLKKAASGKRSRTKGSGRDKAGRSKRKIIVLARYDSGKVCRELKPPIFKSLSIIHYCEMGGIALIPVVLLLRFLTNAEGGLLVFWNVLMAIGIVLTFLPVIKYILHQTAPYSDGANNNAAGVAVMLEVASRIAKSAQEAAALADAAPVMHGEEAVRASGMLPVGTDLIYQESAEGTLAAATPEEEAARAQKLVAEGVISQAAEAAGFVGTAFTAAAGVAADAAAGVVAGAAGAAADSVDSDAKTLVFNDAARSAGSEAAGQDGPSTAESMISAFEASKPQTNVRVQSNTNTQTNVPDWFKKGIEKANANKDENGETQNPRIQRSRYADALDAAAVASANSIAEFEARDAAQQREPFSPTGISEERLRQMREHIMNSSGRTSLAAQAEVAAVAAEAVAADAEAAAKAAADAAATQAARAASVANLTPEEAVSQASSTLMADVAAAVGAQQAAEAAATAQAVEEVAEQAAVADRTIAYIPVAADIPAEISQIEIGEGSIADSVGKSAADILEEAAAVAGEDPEQESARKKRAISLPSLTGAIEGVANQDAPLGDDAERDEGEGRIVASGRRRRTSLEGLPSTNLPAKEPEPAKQPRPAVAAAAAMFAETTAAVAVAANKEGSTTSFLASTEAADTQAALSSLEAPATASTSAPAAPAPAATAAAATKSATDKAASIAPAANASTKAIPAVPLTPADDNSAAKFNDVQITDMVEDDIIIHDVDDSDYTENITHTGAMAGPGYVQMPKSRGQRFRNLFGRKKKAEDSISFSEAVGLEDGFDAREVGAARGGWESFQNESADYDAGTESRSGGLGRRSHVDEYSTNSRSLRFKRGSDWEADAFSENFSDDEWNGGAFSLSRFTGKGGEDDGEGEGRSRTRGGSGDSSRSSSRGGSGNGSTRGGSRKGRRSQGASGTQRRRNPDEAHNRDIDAEDMIEEREQIRSFRTSSAPLTSFEEVARFAGSFSADIAAEVAADAAGQPQAANPNAPHGFGTEVWFVALGAELADNAGIKAFLSQHSDELRGSVVIDLDALGAGDLSIIDEEGTLKRVKTSSRMKRYAQKAGAALGLRINGVKMDWRESAAYFTSTRGLPTIHVAGIKDGKPAYQGELDDKFENLSEDKLLENTAFVLELLNNI